MFFDSMVVGINLVIIATNKLFINFPVTTNKGLLQSDTYAPRKVFIVYLGILKYTTMKISTIKISTDTKKRLDALRAHKRETYEDIVLKTLTILNMIKINPEHARSKLREIDRLHESLKDGA